MPDFDIIRFNNRVYYSSFFRNLMMWSFLKLAPLFAYTPKALFTGRYPLLSGLSASD
jgi:hypothetical protein